MSSTAWTRPRRLHWSRADRADKLSGPRGQIANELRNKRPEHFVDKLSLAEIHASLERAADVLSTVKGSPRGGVSDN
jgi:hypothetical protein